MRPANSATALAEHLGKGAVILGPDGRDVTTAVRTTFTRLLPVTGGDKAAAAVQAVQVALGEQREVRR